METSGRESKEIALIVSVSCFKNNGGLPSLSPLRGTKNHLLATPFCCSKKMHLLFVYFPGSSWDIWHILSNDWSTPEGKETFQCMNPYRSISLDIGPCACLLRLFCFIIYRYINRDMSGNCAWYNYWPYSSFMCPLVFEKVSVSNTLTS